MADLNPAQQQSLFERIGGKAAVSLAVDIFYDRIMADEELTPFFDGVDMHKQKVHQKAFMTYAFGGMEKYTGRNMRDAHKKLVEEKGLNDNHFDKVAKHLRMTLEELEVQPAMIKEVLDIVSTTRDDVLNR